MINFRRTNSSDPAFTALVAKLDAELKVSDGEDHAFYDQYNKLTNIKHALVVYSQGEPVACGAIKHFDEQTVEVKRMFVDQQLRGQGIATKTLTELEDWALALGYKRCILETGINQPAAIALYNKNDYIIIPNYGQYVGVDNSYCFDKILGESFDIYFDFMIEASISEVYRAVTEAADLEKWWPEKCSGKPSFRSVYNFYFTDEYDWTAIISELQPDKSVHYKMTKSDQDWNQTIFGFELERKKSGTLVKFSHKRWPECNHHFRHSAFCWATLLTALKDYVEHGKVIPFADRS